MKELLFLGSLGGGELILIALVILLLFGGKKMNEIEKDIKDVNNNTEDKN